MKFQALPKLEIESFGLNPKRKAIKNNDNKKQLTPKQNAAK